MRLVGLVSMLMPRLLFCISQSVSLPHVCDPDVAVRFNWFYGLKNPPGKCVQFVLSAASPDPMHICLIRHLPAFNYTLHTRSLSTVNEQALDHPHQINYKYCPTIVVLSPGAAELQRLFASDVHHKRFFPHSTVLLLLDPNITVNLSANALSNIHGQALHVLVASVTLRGAIRDVLTGRHIDWTDSTPNTAAFLATHRLHPLFHADRTLNRQHSFRISFFDCPPYVMTAPGNASGASAPVDGYEYQFIAAVTHQWRLQSVTLPARQAGVWDERSLQLLASGSSDLAMCAVWLAEHRAERYDLTRDFDFNCGTFLVARPQPIAAGGNVYDALDRWVWLALAGCLATTTAAWYGLTDVDVARVLVDLVDVMTGHGMTAVPAGRTLKLLFMAWSLLCLVLGVGYATGYTSLMTTPRFESSINSLQEFVDKNVRWGYFEYYMDLHTSTVTNYQRLYQLAERETSAEERSARIRTLDARYAVYTENIMDRYLTAIEPVLEAVLQSKMRLVRTCMYNHYTVFALQKHSPYTAYFNRKIIHFKESGIINNWLQRIQLKYYSYMRQFCEPPVHAYVPTSLTPDNLSGSFWVLLCGFAASLVVFAVELGRAEVH